MTVSENIQIRSPIVTPIPRQSDELGNGPSNVPLVPNFQSNEEAATDAGIVRFFIQSFFVHTNTMYFNLLQTVSLSPGAEKI